MTDDHLHLDLGYVVSVPREAPGETYNSSLPETRCDAAHDERLGRLGRSRRSRNDDQDRQKKRTRSDVAYRSDGATRATLRRGLARHRDRGRVRDGRRRRARAARGRLRHRRATSCAVR